MLVRYGLLALVFVFQCITDIAHSQFYQGSYQEFGKSRVQFNGFGWQYHNYKRFRIYYYGINKDIAVYTARSLHNYLTSAESKLDYAFPEKLEVILYPAQSKFRQSNLGLNNDEQSNVGGTTRIVGSKIFMYYEGDHQKFNANIKSAVYEVLLKHMFFGGDWKDQLKSTVNSGIPKWLENGLVSFLVKGWDHDVESRVKDLILTQKIDHFNDLTAEEKNYAGHAVWNYIAETNGLTIIPNIIYITRVTKNVERGFHSLIGMDFTKLTNAYISFYRTRYLDEYKHQNEPTGIQAELKNKKESVYYGARLSPDGDKIAYVENQLGRYRVKVVNRSTGKVTRIYAAEPKMDRIQDYSYPTLAWHPSGEAVCFFAERKGKCVQYIYTFSDEDLTEKEVADLDKVLEFSYSTDGKKMVMSGVVHGQTDIYVMDVSNNTRVRVTDDMWDDRYPSFADANGSIVFSSNRESDTIFRNPTIDFFDRKFDIFVYDLAHLKHTHQPLERITRTDKANEIWPYQSGKDQFIFLSDKNGLYNRFVSQRDSFITFIDTSIHYGFKTLLHPQTNCVTTIREQHISASGDLVYTVYQNHKYKFFTETFRNEWLDVLWNTTWLDREEDREAKLEKKTDKPEGVSDTLYVGDMKYQKVIVDIGEKTSGGIETASENNGEDSSQFVDHFRVPKFLLYKMNFAKDYVLSQFDNNFLFPSYQPYSGPGSVYFNPGMNMLLKIGGSDLFDDVKLLGGVRIPTSFNSGGEFLFMGEYLKNRVDHRLVVYRQKTVNTDFFYKWITHDVRYRMSYPFSEILALRMNVNVRKDKQVYIPYSDFTLAIDPLNRYNSGLNIELVFDNTIPMELNIRRGTRMKIFAEWLQELTGNHDPTFNFGMDLRKYTRIKRNFMWVNRFAAATSQGDRKLLYYLGAVDNWVLRSNPDFNQEITVDPSLNYGFQTIATPMRGFIQNIRNGNSFALVNSEFRLPVFTFFSSYPIKSDLVRHFQVVAFGDLGVAWTGLHPWHEDNYFNTQVIVDKPVTINVENLREPVVGGFGLGVRSKIWGYFVRMDVAWGVEDMEVQKPRTYISLTTDL